MAERGKQIASIKLEMEQGQIAEIAKAGQLESFIESAVRLFKRDLKAELVAGSAVSTALFYVDDDFGTGPRPPFWHQIRATELLEERVKVLEKEFAVRR